MGCATLDYDLKGQRFRAIVCGGRGIHPCVGCGQLATRQCDFKVVRSGVSRNGLPWQRHGTCSAHVCTACTTTLPGDKDSCPEHKAACLEACKRHGLEVPA